jgi:hypothetical protein
MVDAKKRASNMGHPAMVAKDDRLCGGGAKDKCGGAFGGLRMGPLALRHSAGAEGMAAQPRRTINLTGAFAHEDTYLQCA